MSLDRGRRNSSRAEYRAIGANFSSHCTGNAPSQSVFLQANYAKIRAGRKHTSRLFTKKNIHISMHCIIRFEEYCRKYRNAYRLYVSTTEFVDKKYLCT